MGEVVCRSTEANASTLLTRRGEYAGVCRKGSCLELTPKKDA